MPKIIKKSWIFFVDEQRAKFSHILNTIQYLPILIYGLSSDFGRSIIRPLLLLVGLWAICSGIFLQESCRLNSAPLLQANEQKIEAALLFSASHLLPIISWSKTVKGHYLEVLYGEPPQLNWLINVTAYAEGVLSLILIFLIGLAVRNKLRM